MAFFLPTPLALTPKACDLALGSGPRGIPRNGLEVSSTDESGRLIGQGLVSDPLWRFGSADRPVSLVQRIESEVINLV